GLVAVDDAGQVRGYLVGRGETALVTEAVADDIEAAQSLLADAGQRYKAHGETVIRWIMPPDDAFFYYARQLCDVKMCVEYLRNADWMGRIVDGERLLAALTPEFRTCAGDDVEV